MKHSCRGRAVCKCLDGDKVGELRGERGERVINLQIQTKKKITDVNYATYRNLYKNSRVKYQDRDKYGHNLNHKAAQLQQNLFLPSHFLLRRRRRCKTGS